MLTILDIQHLVTLAGPDFMWTDARGSDRPSNRHPAGGSPRRGLKAWLIAAQDGVCAHCDNKDMPSMAAVPTLADVCHVVGSGPKRKGFVEGNIYAAHSACNTAAARSSFEGEAIGHPRAVAAYVDSIHANTETNEHGYRLVLGPNDFRRADLIQGDWPVKSMGGFRAYDPEA